MGVVTLLRTTGVTTDRLVGSHDAVADGVDHHRRPQYGKRPAERAARMCRRRLAASEPTLRHVTINDATVRVYHAGYRIEQTSVGPPARYQLVRYFCQDGQPSTHFPVVHALKDGTVCSGGVAGTTAVCVLTQPAPRFDLQIVTVSGTQSYTFTATATWRTAISA